MTLRSLSNFLFFALILPASIVLAQGEEEKESRWGGGDDSGVKQLS